MNVFRYVLNRGKLIPKRVVSLLKNHEKRISALEDGSVSLEDVEVTVKDEGGNPIPDAVVSLDDGTVLKTKKG